MLTALDLVVLVGGLAGFGLASLRWLRVAQREHYLPGSVLRFARRWWFLDGRAVALAVGGLAGAALSGLSVAFAIAPPVVAAIGPIGLGVRGRTSPLAPTRRLRTLAALSALVALLVVGLSGAVASWRGAALAAAIVAILAPLVVDLAVRLLAPIEARAAARHVARARRRLAEIAPLVIAITGSYGKTTTKGYVAHLLAGRYQVLASPRSFNNQAGLARTVNELLLPGTEVLVAEMGTYGPGELADLCSWLTPTISVITAIGPVHLERFGRLEAILEAKAEITAPAKVSVLNVDNELLAGLATRLGGEGKRVVACSARLGGAAVTVSRVGDELVVAHGGEEMVRVPLPESHDAMALSNVACAVAVAIELDVPSDEIGLRLGSLPGADNRLQRRTGAGGATILDDTFNSNPAGTELALGALAATGAGRRVVVTPGMIELGPRQREENRRFAAAASEVATDVVVVGRTNRRELLGGLEARRRSGEVRVEVVAHCDDAVAFVRDQLGPGDAVLYENDLPDHYP